MITWAPLHKTFCRSFLTAKVRKLPAKNKKSIASCIAICQSFLMAKKKFGKKFYATRPWYDMWQSLQQHHCIIWHWWFYPIRKTCTKKVENYIVIFNGNVLGHAWHTWYKKGTNGKRVSCSLLYLQWAFENGLPFLYALYIVIHYVVNIIIIQKRYYIVILLSIRAEYLKYWWINWAWLNLFGKETSNNT